MLIDLIQQSISLTPERKEVYVHVIPYLSEAAKADLEAILIREAASAQEAKDREGDAVAKINERFFEKSDALVRHELKQFRSDKETAQTALDNPEKLLEQLDNL